MAMHVQVTGQLLLRNSESFIKRSRKFSVIRHMLVNNFVHLRLKKKVFSASSSPPRVLSHCLYLLETFTFLCGALSPHSEGPSLFCCSYQPLHKRHLSHVRVFIPPQWLPYLPPAVCLQNPRGKRDHPQPSQFLNCRTNQINAMGIFSHQEAEEENPSKWSLIQNLAMMFLSRVLVLINTRATTETRLQHFRMSIKCTESYWWRWWKTLGGGQGKGEASCLFSFLRNFRIREAMPTLPSPMHCVHPMTVLSRGDTSL